MTAGWRIKYGKWIYYNSKGEMAHGWVKNNGRLYRTDDTGYLLQNTWKEIDGELYYFNGSGEALVGWNCISNEYYYFYPTETEEHRMCSMAHDTIIDGYYIDDLGRRK